MAYFQDLPEEYQEKIFEGLKKDLIEDSDEPEYIDEEVDNHINCLNYASKIKEWVIEYCL